LQNRAVREKADGGALSIEACGQRCYHLKGLLERGLMGLLPETADVNHHKYLFLFRRFKNLLLQSVVPSACLPVNMPGRSAVMIVDGAKYVNGIIDRTFPSRYAEEIPFGKSEGMEGNEPRVYDDLDLLLSGVLMDEESQRVA
jgi:hypothetical protein